MDNKQETSNPSEYQFKEEEYVPSFQSEPEVDTGLEGGEVKRKMPIKIGKKIIIAIAVLVILFLVYQFFSPKRSSVPKDLGGAMPAPQTQVTPAPSSQVSSLQQSVDASNAKVSQLEEQVAQNQASLSTLTTSVYNLNATVVQLANELKQVQAQLAKRPAKKGRRVVGYHVRAIVPGRAWLQSAKGITFTVRPGSVLKGYGTVENIDPYSGTITTSSGDTVRYGSNDI